jgi:site-specific DNA-cytosine methylase
MLKVLDLFSGCGSEALGFQRAGFTIAGLCEIKPWLRSLLRRRFPGVPVHDDVHTQPVVRADILAGGPPCQKTSIAAAIHGKRTGASLWPAMFRIGLDMDPEWIVVEQPTKNKAWETKVANDLAASGRHCARAEFSAADLGAPHQRRRVFILAHRDLSRLQSAWSAIPSTIESLTWGALAGNPWAQGVPRALRVAAGPSDRTHRTRRIEAIGDSNPPIMYEVIARAILSGRPA